MTDAAHNPDDYCYRHPDRLSFVLCERCGRTICLECQNHVDGKVLCPDDAYARVTQISEARAARPKRKRRRQSQLLARVGTDTPLVTYVLMGVLVVTFLVDAITRGLLTTYLGVFPAGTANSVLHQPWSLLTSMFLAGSILGLLFNGYSLFVLGRQLERLVGRQKLLVLYIISGFGAAVFAFLLDGAVTAAYGAVFGLVGATVLWVRRMGGNHTILYVTCAVSLVISIIFGGWQATIGGALAGAAVAFTYLFEDDRGNQGRTRLLLGALVALLLVIAVVRALVFGG